MKITKIPHRGSGMTLLELTVAILVLLSLIGILFIGARGWKRGTDRSGCILNLRIAQQAVRSYQNMYGLSPGQPFDMKDKVVGPDKFLSEPNCPSGGDYSFIDRIPLAGEMALQCSLQASDKHVPENTIGW